jgi:hypothetical protein
MKRTRHVWILVDAEGFPCPACDWWESKAAAKSAIRDIWCHNNPCAPGPHRIAKFVQEESQ